MPIRALVEDVWKSLSLRYLKEFGKALVEDVSRSLVWIFQEEQRIKHKRWLQKEIFVKVKSSIPSLKCHTRNTQHNQIMICKGNYNTREEQQRMTQHRKIQNWLNKI